MKILTSLAAAVSLLIGPTLAYGQTLPFDPSQIVSVSCDTNYDPPVIHIILLKSQGFTVSTAFYQSLQQQGYPLPANPCGGN